MSGRPTRRDFAAGIAAAACGTGIAGAAAAKLPVVASFSILADLARAVGGEEVVVTSLVGPDSDPHVFEPSPEKLRVFGRAQLFVVNGLGFEGWLTRLVQSAQYRGPVVVASEAVTPLPAAGATPDPHAWQDVMNAVRYAETIATAFARRDPAHAAAYRARLLRYRERLEALDRWVREALSPIPEEKRRVITTHDAFAYYGHAYGVRFIAPLGISTNSEPSAKAIAGLLRQIREQHIRALFLENIADPRLMQQLAHDSGAYLGPPLYSDALSGPAGPAPSYIRMVMYNTAALKTGMLKN